MKIVGFVVAFRLAAGVSSSDHEKNETANNVLEETNSHGLIERCAVVNGGRPMGASCDNVALNSLTYLSDLNRGSIKKDLDNSHTVEDNKESLKVDADKLGEAKEGNLGNNQDNRVDEAIYSAKRTPFNEFIVAGINLADYRKHAPFELYEDFDISEYIQGDETWDDLLAYRNQLDSPSLSFYVDKVARKRWLPTKGYNQPKIFSMFYAEELSSGKDVVEQERAILELLPVNQSFAAKPTHMSLNSGNWLVSYGTDNVTRFSTRAREVTDENGNFNATDCAKSLAQSLRTPCASLESWALKNVRPGLVIEERWSSLDNVNAPPDEFSLFTIWGKVWTGNWNFVSGQKRHWKAFFHRNGTVALSTAVYGPNDSIPDWVPWAELVRIAEELGAHKDMFRTDIFVGRPSTMSGPGNEHVPLQIAVSESEIFPTTIFDNDDFTNEGARLWVAGYELGIYDLVKNTEVPKEFLRRGMLSAPN